VRGTEARAPAEAGSAEERVKAALLKHERGESLTETETLVVYWHLHGGGCHACGGSGYRGVNVVLYEPAAPEPSGSARGDRR